MNLTPEQIHILRHSLGLNEKGHGNQYRNYYCTGTGHQQCESVKQLADFGLMAFSHSINDGRDKIFFVTPQGITMATAGVVYPKFTRSQRRMRAYRSSDTGLTFREWLATKWGKMAY